MRIRGLASMVVASTGVAVFGCGDPLPPPARVAVSLELASCTVFGRFSLPKDPAVNATLTPNIIQGDLQVLPRLVDGQDNSTVSCRVVETAPGVFEMSANARTGTTGTSHFSISGGTSVAGSGTASKISFRVPETDLRQGSNCTINTELAPEGGGGMLASFTCKPFHDPGVPNESCSVTGTFALDRCDR